MSILVIAEHSNQEIKSSTLNSIMAASEINDDLRTLYEQNFGMESHADSRAVDPKKILKAQSVL